MGCYNVRMDNLWKSKKIKIRDARPLLNKLTEEVAKDNSYYVITVRDRPVSILAKYDEKLIQSLDQKSKQRLNQGKSGSVFSNGMSKWLKNNPPVIVKEDITSQIDKITYG